MDCTLPFMCGCRSSVHIYRVWSSWLINVATDKQIHVARNMSGSTTVVKQWRFKKPIPHSRGCTLDLHLPAVGRGTRLPPRWVEGGQLAIHNSLCCFYHLRCVWGSIFSRGKKEGLSLSLSLLIFYKYMPSYSTTYIISLTLGHVFL